MDIIEALRLAGVEGNKADFYLAALELGQASVTAIAQRAGIGRTNAYEVMDRLTTMGLIGTIDRGSRTLVIAQDPTILVRRLDEQRKALNDVLPELRSIHNSSQFKPKARYFEGLEGIRTILDETLSCRSKLLYGILSMDQLLNVPGPEIMQKYIERRIRAGINLRVIRSYQRDIEHIWPGSNDERRELRFAPPHLDFGMTMYLYDSTVVFISSRKERYALSIQSEESFEMQLALFRSVWDSSVPPNASNTLTQWAEKS